MNREKEILEQALNLASDEEKVAFIKGACRGDAAMRERLTGLLRPSEGAGVLPLAGPASVATVKLSSPANDDEALGSRIDHYKLLQNVGEGGCGVVYMAEQEEPVRRRVALKVIKLGMDTKAVVARFEAERQALAMMDHPNIARVLDAGTTDKGRPYFVMELVRGIRITDYCDENHLTTKARLELFISVCRAVQHAHQKGIIHRDLKPSNILVTLHDGVPVPKVIDFGIAKAIEQKLTDKTLFTELHQFIGTPAYMSPEQAEMSGLDIDTRSDIYSLGVLLYELLAGRTPFDAQELVASGLDAMRKTIREREPLRPSTQLATLKGEELTTTAKRRSVEVSKLAGQLRGDLDWIVMKCLEKDRTRRYEAANELAIDIKRHLSNEPVFARPPSTAYRLRKAFRRNRLAFAAGAAVAVALLAGIAVSTWQAMLARKAQRETEAARNGEQQQRFEAQSAQQLAETERQRAEANAERFRTAAIQSRRRQYAADLLAATLEIEKNSYGSAREFLREYLPRPGTEELRGFEWRYWWQLSAGRQLSTFPIGKQVLAMAWSPDGRLIAAGSSDETIALVRADSGQVVSVLTNGSDWNVSVAFSHDGSGLAAAGQDGWVNFWNVQDGRLLFQRRERYPKVSCSPNGPIMAIGTGGDLWGQRGDAVHLVDTTSGKNLRVLPNAGDRAVFSPDGKTLATANRGHFNSGSQAVILWEVHSGRQLRVLQNMVQVMSMAFSPDGQLLAISNRRGEIILWNLNDFTHAILRRGTGESAWSVAFSPEGGSLAVALSTQEVEVWDVAQQRQVQRLPGHAHEVRAIAFSPDGTRVASGSLDGTIKLWDPRPPAVQELIPNVKLSPLGNPMFSPDSRWVAAATRSGDVPIVDPRTPAWDVRTVLTNAGFPVAFSGETLWTLGRDFSTLRRWNVASRALLSTVDLNSSKEWPAAAITPDGSRLALAQNGVVDVYDTQTGRMLDHFQNPRNHEAVDFSRDGQLLAIGAGDSALIRDIASARVIWKLAGHQDRVVAISFSPDQKTIATASWDHTARLWDVATGKNLAVLTGHKSAVKSCAFSRDGRTLVTGSDDRTIKFWHLATLRQIASIQLNYPVRFLAFSPDGLILTANNAENSLCCWRLPSLAEIDPATAQEEPKSIPPSNR